MARARPLQESLLRLGLLPVLAFAVFAPMTLWLLRSGPASISAWHGAGAWVAGVVAAVSVAILQLRSLRRAVEQLDREAARVATSLSLEVAGPHRLDQLSGLLGSIGQRLADGSRIAEERRHLLAVVESLQEAVRVTDSDGNTIFENHQWQGLVGELDRDSGSVEEIKVHTEIDRLLRATLEGGAGASQEIRRGPAHDRTTVMISCRALADLSGALIVAQDMTPILRLAEMRRDFVGNVSHELRTPLAAIRAFAETLADGALDDRQAAPRFIGRILHQCTRLELLLADLLVLSRLERPETIEQSGEVDLAEIVHETIDTLSGQAGQSQVEVLVEGVDSAPLRGDPGALEKLCSNLLLNAILYNRPGGKVHVKVSRDPAGIVLLEVSDTGIGIPKESLDRLFERFYRVDRGRSRSEGGTGLGLAIVKHAAQLHGGGVEVESVLGKGSVFRVRLPGMAS